MKAKRKHRPGLSEHIQNNAECLRRLILIVSIALPHTTNDISALMSEWVKIHKEINTELEASTKA